MMQNSSYIECKRCKVKIPACQEYCRECENRLKEPEETKEEEEERLKEQELEFQNELMGEK